MKDKKYKITCEKTTKFRYARLKNGTLAFDEPSHHIFTERQALQAIGETVERFKSAIKFTDFKLEEVS